jgi:hypothetical protein
MNVEIGTETALFNFWKFFPRFSVHYFCSAQLKNQMPIIWGSFKDVWPLPCSPPVSSIGILFASHDQMMRGWGVNILEDARHWIGLLQYNPSTDERMAADTHVFGARFRKLNNNKFWGCTSTSYYYQKNFGPWFYPCFKEQITPTNTRMLNMLRCFYHRWG